MSEDLRTASISDRTFSSRTYVPNNLAYVPAPRGWLSTLPSLAKLKSGWPAVKRCEQRRSRGALTIETYVQETCHIWLTVSGQSYPGRGCLLSDVRHTVQKRFAHNPG